MARYSAKLLFQFRVEIQGDSGKRRLCEERIIHFEARSPREALRSARRRGRNGEYAYANADGNAVSFEFVGVMGVLRLGAEAGDGEVWYDIRERLLPMERREELLPAEEDLLRRLAGSNR